MKSYEEKRKQKIYEIVSIVKLLSVLFCGIIIFNLYGISNNAERVLKYKNFDPITIGLLCIVILMLMYETWLFSRANKRRFVIEDKKIIIETIVFIVIFSVLIVLSGGYQSPYKVIFLFIIIVSTIEFGMNYGVTTAAVCAGIVLLLDYISVPQGTINVYFETDLILTGIFLLTAWLLGDYVKLENDYREHMRDLIHLDELTEVYNHRFFQDELNQQIIKAEENNLCLSLLFIDIDYFKNYNDLYGHLQGDKVLKNIAQILKNSINDQQTLARYGGEEFAVIAPSISEEEAIELGEKIRCAIENTCFEGEENLPGKKLTISIGVSCFPDKAKTKLELINSADDALYRAKFFNKNRVEAYVSVLDELKKDIETEHIDLISSFKTLISVINAKDRYTYGHTERVVIYCKLIAEKLGLNEEEKRILKYGAYLHDIGKINIPIDILNKKTKLTFDEWKMIKSHPEQGIEILKHVPSLQDIIPLILHHHEKYDGTGYPSGLKGEEIPYLVRILSVADSFDAMTSNRPYQTRKDYQQAMEELQRCKAMQFDPNIVDMFVEVVREKEGFIS